MMKVRKARTRLLLAGALVGTSAVALAVAGASFAGAQASNAPSPHLVDAPAPIISAPSAGYVVIQPSAVLRWDEANATLTPLNSSATKLVSAATAYDAVKNAITNAVTTGLASGPPTAGFYSYTNSAYGAIQSDGSVKLSYINTPVWEFSVPLWQYVDDSQGGLGVPKSQVKRSGCSFYEIVDATSGDFLTGGEECTTVVLPRGPDLTPLN